MPKKTGALPANIAHLPEEGFLREPAAPLSLEERQQLRAFFGSPLWQKVWRNALTQAPNSVVPEGNPAFTSIHANNRLYQMQGWDKFRLALLAQIEDKIPRPPRPPENYPNPLEIQTKK